MRRSHRARLDKLSAARDNAEREAASERRMLRCYAAGYPLVRDAMLRAGLDPAESSAIRDIAEKLAGFVDTPELRRADAELPKAEKVGSATEFPNSEDPREWLNAHLDEVGRRYKKDGTLPDFGRADFWHLLAWATPPDDREAPATNDPPPQAVEGSAPEAAARGSPVEGTAVRGA